MVKPSLEEKKRWFKDICILVNLFKELIVHELCLPEKGTKTLGYVNKSGGWDSQKKGMVTKKGRMFLKGEFAHCVLLINEITVT